MKLKNILCAAVLSAAVAIVFCGCGPSEEEVYEHLARVEEKANKIEKADLSMDQGFQEKWDLLKRKQAAADRAFSKNDYNATSKFLQEAESAADWILNQGPLRAEADEKKSTTADRKKVANVFFAQASSYYREAASYERQGNTAYEKGNFEEAAHLFGSAATNYRQALGDFISYYFVKVEPGTFKREEQQVTLTKPFYIGKYEVTQAQWQYVMGNNPSYPMVPNRPVKYVNWHDAMAFCEKLNESGKAPKGWKFTLPTEAQWEFAARGGNRSKGYEYSGSNDIKEVAWYYDNSDATHDVGEKKPNELGLYDMSGNVREWCLDINGSSGSYRVLRGGSWNRGAHYCHVAYRDNSIPVHRSDEFGFRLALVPVQ